MKFSEGQKRLIRNTNEVVFIISYFLGISLKKVERDGCGGCLWCTFKRVEVIAKDV
ncbi:hypothetical protein [Pustulibacterium marinum]|uniref:hypothetical protein n=1 Tax=Pustulibacterium marinum TaxID=1224947 RepID=UPI001C42F8FD|nr:hypothetical protein [Pustulibacterium marinum]